MAAVATIQIGIDIGQKRDPTAIAVVDVQERQRADTTFETVYVTRFLERLPLGTSYPRIAARLGSIVQNAEQAAWQEYFQKTGHSTTFGVDFTVFVDATGVGQPVVDILEESGVSVTPCYFTHGDRRSVENGRVSIGKAWMVSRLKALFQTQRILLPDGHPEAIPLRNELLDYEIRVDDNANDRYGAFKTGAHDDLVTAVGLATQAAADSYIREPTGALAEYLSRL